MARSTCGICTHNRTIACKTVYTFPITITLLCAPRTSRPHTVSLTRCPLSVPSFIQIMEFLPGGDLMSLLMKEDIFPEVATKQASAVCFPDIFQEPRAL